MENNSKNSLKMKKKYLVLKMLKIFCLHLVTKSYIIENFIISLDLNDSRDKLTLSILQLREDGILDELKKKWWIEKSQCPLETVSKVNIRISDAYLLYVYSFFDFV